ncbi:MAG: alpha-glucosidase/alpha-galactosidase [Planctomycetota bacterium]
MAAIKTKSAICQQATDTSTRLDGIKICYIGGGSVAWAHKLMGDLALCQTINGEVRLYDVVPERARLNEKYGQKVFQLPQVKSKWRWRAVTRLSDALKGADFVFLSITPGQLETMAREIEICERYGLWHPVGDTIGPAGLMRCLRTARLYAGFARAVMAHAPKAWVINYTNPMTVCTRAVYAVEPQIKAFGCCHEVFGTQELLAKIVEKYLHVPPPSRREIKCNVTGINHFTWLTKTTWKGMDLKPLWQRFFREEASVQPRYTWDQIKEHGVCHSFYCIAAALSLRHDALAAAGDRHLAEFAPGFLISKDDLHRWGICLTPVREYRITNFNNRVNSIRQVIAGKETLNIKQSDEEAIPQLLAILGVADLKTNVNLPNVGQIPDLPRGAIVETNAYFSRDSVIPLTAGETPRTLLPLLATHVANQEQIVQAALTKDSDLALAVITNDPLNRLPFDKTAEMFRELMAATKPWSFSTDAPR